MQRKETEKMKKDILDQYIDACELVKETEEDLFRMRRHRSTVVRDSVKGSMHEFPYTSRRFHVEGIPGASIGDSEQEEQQEQLLELRRQKAAAVKLQVETWVNTAPVRIQRIIRFKVFEKCSWEQVAAKLGRGATADSVRKEFVRFMNEE